MEEHPSASARERWEEMAAAVAYALAYDLQTSLRYFDKDAVLIPSDARDDDPLRVDQRKRFLRMYESERAFVWRVWDAVTSNPHQGNVVVLFDVDQTLGSRKSTGERHATLVRPAAAPLMEQLKAAGVAMGIITSRGMSELRRNLDDALHLRGIQPYLDDGHLTAAEMELHEDRTVAYSSAEVEPEVFSRFAELLRPPYNDLDRFRAYRDARGKPLPAIDLNKMLQITHTRGVHPDIAFLVVDDREYAALVQTRDRLVTGVYLAEHERAHF